MNSNYPNPNPGGGPGSILGTPGVGLLALGLVLMVSGAQFTEPARLATLNPPFLKLVALGAHIGGGILTVIGAYRVYRNRRDSRIP